MSKKVVMCAACIPLIMTAAMIPLASAKVVTLKYAHWDYNPGIDAAIKKWNRLNPNIQVTFEAYGWPAIFEKIPVQIAAGTPPDMFSELSLNGRFDSLVEKGLLKDLSPYFKADFNVNDMFSTALESVSTDKGIWAMPFGLSNQGFLLFNIDHFTQTGITLPDKSWDLNDFTEAMRKLTKDINGDGKADRFGFAGAGFRADEIYSANGRIFNETGKKMALDSAEAVRILKWHADLYQKYRVVGGGLTSNNAATGFGAPQWFLNDIRGMKKGTRVAATLWPKDPVTGLRRFEPDHNFVVVPRTAKHPKEAWKFLKWFVSKDGLASVSRDSFGTSQLLPVLKSVANSDLYLKPKTDIVPQTIDMSVFVEGIEKYTIKPPRIRNHYDLRQMLSSRFNEVTTGKVSVEQFIKKATSEGNQILSRR